jgi:hypothetical protein
VPQECDHDRILALFASRRGRDRDQAVFDAYVDRHADELLAQMMDASVNASYDKLIIAAHLGDLHGEAGSAALRRAITVTGPGTRDLRCASLLALAKREGAAASPELRSALGNGDGTVKDYAVIGLAGAGDGTAWDEVFARLPALLKRSRRASGQSEVEMALAYLAQHLDQQRQAQLVLFVRKRWLAINEADWFREHWPDARPAGPPTDAVRGPDPAAVRAWAQSPLFRSRGIPTVLG